MAKRLAYPEALEQARRYCARQERAHQEVRDKLYSWGLYRDAVEEALGTLIGEGFLNEQRFAEAYALGKFRKTGWGRRKIRQGLELKRVSGPCVRLGLAAIEEDEYLQGLRELADRRLNAERRGDAFERRERTVRYLIGRGFEPDLVREVVQGME